jgi:hypothetical protein
MAVKGTVERGDAPIRANMKKIPRKLKRYISTGETRISKVMSKHADKWSGFGIAGARSAGTKERADVPFLLLSISRGARETARMYLQVQVRRRMTSSSDGKLKSAD